MCLWPLQIVPYGMIWASRKLDGSHKFKRVPQGYALIIIGTLGRWIFMQNRGPAMQKQRWSSKHQNSTVTQGVQLWEGRHMWHEWPMHEIRNLLPEWMEWLQDWNLPTRAGQLENESNKKGGCLSQLLACCYTNHSAAQPVNPFKHQKRHDKSATFQYWLQGLGGH